MNSETNPQRNIANTLYPLLDGLALMGISQGLTAIDVLLAQRMIDFFREDKRAKISGLSSSMYLTAPTNDLFNLD